MVKLNSFRELKVYQKFKTLHLEVYIKAVEPSWSKAVSSTEAVEEKFSWNT